MIKDNAMAELRPILLRNTKLMVRLASDDTNTFYNSRIEDMNDNSLFISMPTHKGMPLKVIKDTVIYLSALTANGRYIFESQVEGILKDDIYMLQVKFPTVARQEQMRQFFRVPVHLRIRLATGKNDPTGIDTQVHDAYLVNISGGGCCVSTKVHPVAGELVQVDFSCTAVDGVGLVDCEVVRVSAEHEGKRQIGLRYADMDERMRDKLVKYVFRRQLELRQLTD